jgi:hypothetical protein
MVAILINANGSINVLTYVAINEVGDNFLKIALPAKSTVRTILLSAREFDSLNDGL